LAADGALLVNPRAQVTVRRHGADVASVIVGAPVRGDCLRISVLRRAEEPALVDLLVAVARGDEVEVEGPDLDRLMAAGLLVDVDAIPAPVRYDCPLATSAPSTSAQREPLEHGGWLVNPTLQISRRGVPDDGEPRVVPPSGAEGFRAGGETTPIVVPLQPGRPWIWLEEPDTSWPSGYSVEPQVVRALEALARGSPLPTIPTEAWSSWAEAGVVGPAADYEQRRAASEACYRDAARRLATDRYSPARSLIPPAQLQSLRRYFRSLVAEGYCERGDAQVANRFVLHDEPLARFLHERLVGLACRLAGETVKRSYVYMASYFDGASLKAHLDREQCELSLSLLLDYEPEPEGPSPWPLLLRRPDSNAGPTPVHQAPGDGLWYRGRELLHSRDALPRGHRSTSLFFHFVPESFSGPLA
jgi:hypothetical protein